MDDDDEEEKVGASGLRVKLQKSEQEKKQLNLKI